MFHCSYGKVGEYTAAEARCSAVTNDEEKVPVLSMHLHNYATNTECSAGPDPEYRDEGP